MFSKFHVHAALQLKKKEKRNLVLHFTNVHALLGAIFGQKHK